MIHAEPQGCPALDPTQSWAAKSECRRPRTAAQGPPPGPWPRPNSSIPVRGAERAAARPCLPPQTGLTKQGPEPSLGPTPSSRPSGLPPTQPPPWRAGKRVCGRKRGRGKGPESRVTWPGWCCGSLRGLPLPHVWERQDLPAWLPLSLPRGSGGPLPHGPCLCLLVIQRTLAECPISALEELLVVGSSRVASRGN